ncbi:hypothetical protein AB1Y20_013654, partial [Prymnesium parvum]
ASTDVVEREISKLGKHVDKELLDLYTKGFLGPKVPHIERVLLRLDNISTNGLRIQQLRGSSRERSTSPVREACQSLESRLAACFSSPKIDSELRWVVIHTQLAFAEATGMLRPLLSAILAMRVHGQATDGSNETSAPGLSERVQRLEASLRADYEKQLESANFVLMYHPYRCSLKALLEKYCAGEADHLLRVAGHDFQRSLAGDGVTPVRTSSTSWCNVPSCLNDPTFQEVRARISNLTKVPWQYAEHLQVLQYKQGQFYHDHHDQNAPRHSAWGPRLYTFYMYLSDVEKGGETRFTRLNISVAPRKGTAVLWPSVLSENPLVTDERTYHEAVDVEEGVKYGANFWVHMYEFQEALQRGCDNRDYFQDDMLAARVGKRRADATKQRSVASTT